jgi:transcription termination factor NusB
MKQKTKTSLKTPLKKSKSKSKQVYAVYSIEAAHSSIDRDTDAEYEIKHGQYETREEAEKVAKEIEKETEDLSYWDALYTRVVEEDRV